jgi:hypothetical protein
MSPSQRTAPAQYAGRLHRLHDAKREVIVGRGRSTRANAHALPAIKRQCRPDSADIPTGERAVRRKLLHLLRDFSQSAILRHMSGNSADISKDI